MTFEKSENKFHQKQNRDREEEREVGAGRHRDHEVRECHDPLRVSRRFLGRENGRDRIDGRIADAEVVRVVNAIFEKGCLGWGVGFTLEGLG